MFVVFDLDGTLSLNAHRQHFLEQVPKRWDEWHAACAEDPPCLPVIETLRLYYAARPAHRVEIWSGRSDVVRRETERWLLQQGINPLLLKRMRPAKDHRPDVDLKRKWLCEARANGGAPDLVYDDRDRVVAMWREEGVRCFQVAPGPF